MNYIWITVAVFLVLRAEAAPGKTNAKFSRFIVYDYNKDHDRVVKDHCASHPCQHGGTCHTSHHFPNYKCDCPAGWSGYSCEKVDVCSNNPCQNSGTCHHSLFHHHGFYCTCATGYVGSHCEIDVSAMSDPCGDQPCKNGGECKSTGDSYVCTCTANWSGTRCDKDINECDNTDQCKNGGNCTNTDGAFSCNCKYGWTGTVCDKDINECDNTDQCKNGGTCTNTDGAFSCNCIAGWTGTLCDNDIDECTMYHICQNSATCLNLPGTFHCTCATGYSGVQCAHEDDPCMPTNPCKNGATCNKDSSGQATCSCLPGYFGALCDKGQPNTCDHICTLQSLASQHSLQSANAASCPSSPSFGSNEALPMQCCSTLASSSWTKGPDVMTQCNSGTMTPYTTVAIFRSDGSVEPNTAGILTECLSGGAGFSIVRQDCTSLPTLIHVNGTAFGKVDNNPGHYSIVL